MMPPAAVTLRQSSAVHAPDQLAASQLEYRQYAMIAPPKIRPTRPTSQKVHGRVKYRSRNLIVRCQTSRGTSGRFRSGLSGGRLMFEIGTSIDASAVEARERGMKRADSPYRLMSFNISERYALNVVPKS
jgi:hypothetical protein